MNKKLPFHVPAVGLLSAFLPQIAQAELLAPEVVFTTPSVTPDHALVDANGVPVLVNNGQYLVLPDRINTPVTVQTLGKEFKFAAGAKRENVVATVQSFLSKNPGAANNVSVQIVKTDNVKPTLQFTQATAAALNVSRVQSAATGVNFRDPSPVSATVSDTLVGSKIGSGAISGLVIGPDNSLQATAIGSTQTVSQTLATGETSVAAALLDNTVIKSTTTATLENSNVGVIATGTLSGDGGITVEGNSAGAVARANDSSASATAVGAGKGDSGVAEIPTLGTAPAAASSVTIKGDVIAAGLQILDSGSDVKASTQNTDVGLSLQGGTIRKLAGGVTVQDNAVATAATGNRLSLGLTSNLAGGNVGASAYALQTAQDSNISASTQGVDAGVVVTPMNAGLDGTQILVDSNAISSSASANSATTVANVNLGDASSALAVGSDQYLTGKTQELSVSADLGGSRLGLTQTSMGAAVAAVTDNSLAAGAVGNEQRQSLSLQGALVNANAPVQAAQTLDGSAHRIDISAKLGLDGDSQPAAILLGIDGAPLGSGSSLQVQGNALAAQAIGNRGTQSLADYSGRIANSVTLEQTQSGSGTLAVESTLANTRLGSGEGVNQSFASSVSVQNNTLTSVARLNQQQQSVGDLLGSVSGSVATTATQTASGTSAKAKIDDLDLGVRKSTGSLSQMGSAPSISVDGNRIGAEAALNSATQVFGAVDGTVSGSLSSNATQTVSPSTAATGAEASVSDIKLGLAGDSANLQPNGSFAVSADRNVVSASAQANRLDRSIGALSGSIGAVDQNASQSSDGANVKAAVSGVAVGVDITSAGISTQQISFGVSDNRVQASAQQNRYSSTAEGITGVVAAGGGLNNSLTQNVNGGDTSAKLGNLGFGAAGLGLGQSSGTTTSVIVDGNSTRADVAGNIASLDYGSSNGSFADGAGATITQSVQGGSYSAESTGLGFGAWTGKSNEYATSAPVLFDVTSNQAATVAFGNAADVSLGDQSGQIAAGGRSGLNLTQSLDSKLSAKASGVDFGVITGGKLDGASNATLPANVSRNTLATLATGNSSSVDLGSLDGSLQSGTSASTIQQNFGTGTSSQAGIEASTSGTTIGVKASTAGLATPAQLTVGGNRVSTSAVANNHSATAALNGAITGEPSLSETQTTVLNAAGKGVTASASGIAVGVTADKELGANLQTAVSDNTVSVSVAGNSATDALSVTAAPLTQPISLTGTQSLTGAGASAKLSASLSGIDVGLKGPAAMATSSAPANGAVASVSGNQLLASSVGNTAVRSVDASGVLNGQGASGSQVLAMVDTQSILNGYVSASISDSSVGSKLSGSPSAPLNLSTANNQVIAQAVGNSAQQRVSLDGAIASARPVTSLTANQSLIGTTVTASLSGISVGVGPNGPSALQFQGSAITSGNTVGATAIGNSTQLIRQ